MSGSGLDADSVWLRNLSLIAAEVLLAIFLLVQHSVQGDDAVKHRIYRRYLEHTRCINNWDLVDATAEHIVGAFLMTRCRRPLTRLAKSGSVWERRIAFMSTFHFIKQGDSAETLRVAKCLLNDPQDLIHKAVG